MEDKKPQADSIFTRFKRMFIASNSADPAKPPLALREDDLTLDHKALQLIEMCCEYLRSPENLVEGIMRIPGSTATVSFMWTMWEQSMPLQFMPVDDAHNVASFLKSVLRRFALIPAAQVSRWLALTDARDRNDPNNEYVSALIRQLPALNRQALLAVMQVVVEVSKHHAITQMDLPSVATVLGPNLIKAPAGEDGYETSAKSSQVAIMLANHLVARSSREELNDDVEGIQEPAVVGDKAPSVTIDDVADDETTGENVIEDGALTLEGLRRQIQALQSELTREKEEREALAELVIQQLAQTQQDLQRALKTLTSKSH